MTPIVFIHWGDRSYLELAHKQAFSHDNPVYVIIKDTPLKYSMEVDRWFVLRDFMRDKELNRCVYLDSDVLLYTNVHHHFRYCDMAISQRHSGHTSFINYKQVIEDFCTYIEDNINNQDLVRKTRERLPNNVFPDSIGDMVLLNNFVHDSSYYFMDTSEGRYDHNINTEPPVERISGLPYRSKRKLNSLHFQGGAKSMMKEWTNV